MMAVSKRQILLQRLHLGCISKKTWKIATYLLQGNSAVQKAAGTAVMLQTISATRCKTGLKKSLPLRGMKTNHVKPSEIFLLSCYSVADQGAQCGKLPHTTTHSVALLIFFVFFFIFKTNANEGAETRFSPFQGN